MSLNQRDNQQERAILIVESTGLMKTITLDTELFTIGRHHNCSLVLSDKMISRYHATIAYLKDPKNSSHSGYWIVDGKGEKQRSTNGIKVNGRKNTMHRLSDGDVITLGKDYKLTYSHIVDTVENIQINNLDNVIYL